MIEKILQDLLAQKKLSEAKLSELRETASRSGSRLEQLLLERGMLTEETLLQGYAQELGLVYQESLGKAEVPPLFTQKVSASFARNHNLVAIGRENGCFTVATASPLDIHSVDDLASLLGTSIELVVAPRGEIADLITRAYQREGEDIVDQMLDKETEEDYGALERELEVSDDLLDIANKAPVIKLVNMIIFQAIKMRSSDIHFQPFQNKMQVRYRIDGILYDMMTPPKKIQEAIVSRIKVMAKMDIAERRLPQDGGISLKAANRDIDLRVSSIPTVHGERIVLRIQDKSKGIYALEHIGMSEEDLALFRKLIDFSHGIILVTGPTGSGKTTTLYAALSRLNTQDLNIITIENPVEYQLPGISQIEVSTKKGMTFATGLRSIVRQDPDIIMVGEIRDLETAEIAIQAALTGHLVFSTLHTNDAPGAITRLVNLGVEPFLVASSVIAVEAQRLVRLICPHCKESYRPDPAVLAELGATADRIPPGGLYRGKGCAECMQSGYRERTSIHELLPIDDDIREQVIKRTSSAAIKREAVTQGKMRTLRMNGTLKMLQGLTTPEEVMSVTQRDAF
jgi:general secretion pathway protein E